MEVKLSTASTKERFVGGILRSAFEVERKGVFFTKKDCLYIKIVSFLLHMSRNESK